MWRKIVRLFLVIGCVGLMACGDAKPQSTAQVAIPEEASFDEATEPKVYFNWQSGIYDDDELRLEMFCPVENAKIYYTTDGTVPDEKSNEYKGELLLADRTYEPEIYAARTDYCTDSDYTPVKRIVKANIIRAIALFEDGTRSETTDGTFVVGQDRLALYGDAPIISLMTDPENLFHDETGIFILGKAYRDWLAENPQNKEEPSYRVVGNFSNKGREWEKPVSFEFMPADGNNVAANMGLRMKGASTRTYLQKSMKLIAREEYGTKKLKAELIPGNWKSDKSEEIKKYKSFVLRNGGNDNGFGKLRDPLIQALAASCNFETQQSTPCVVFLNGEYWGLYAITEDYTDDYIETNYGIDEKNVVIIKRGEVEEGEEEDIALFEELYHFITSNDMSNPENYQKAEEMLDIPGLLDYVALCLYIDNHDSLFDDNNWSLWRVRKADGETAWSDGKWRFLIYDNEFSSGVYTGGEEYNVDTFSERLKGMQDESKEYDSEFPLVHILRSLYSNQDFRDRLIVALCNLRNYQFSREHFSRVFDEISPQYKLLAGESIYRFGPDWVVKWQDPYDYYDEKLKEVKKYFEGRYKSFPDIMNSAFHCGKAIQLTVKVSIDKTETVRLNDTVLDFTEMEGSLFTGDYFKDCPITVSAPNVSKWKVSGAAIVEDNGNEITILPSKNCKIEAVY